MSRLLLVLAACSSSASSPSPPPAPAAPVGFSREVPALANVDALDYLPASMLEGVLVASSLDDLDAKLGPALGLFEDLTGLAPAGIARTRPVGVVRVGGVYEHHWIAFGEVGDATLFDSSVPEARRIRRGKLAFIADSEATLEIVTSNPYQLSIARDAGFRAAAEALQLGALVSWWDNGRMTGIALADHKLRVRVVGKDRGLVHHASLREPPQPVGRAHFVRGTAPKELVAERDAVRDDYDRARKQLVGEREMTVRELVLELGLGDGSPLERTFDIPGGDAKHWLAHRVERYRASALVRTLRALEPRLAALDDRVDRALDASAEAAETKMMAGWMGPSGRDTNPETQAMIDALTAVQTPTDASFVAPRSAGGSGRGSRGGGAGELRVGTGSGPHQPAVTIGGSGDATLRAHLQSRLARVRACYDRALERDPKLRASVSIALSANNDGAVAATATTGDRSLASCIEVATRGTSTAKGASATFTVDLAP